MAPLLVTSGYSLLSTVFIAPLFFGIAHVHHAYQMYKDRGSTSEALNSAIFISCMSLLRKRIWIGDVSQMDSVSICIYHTVWMVRDVDVFADWVHSVSDCKSFAL
jgi:hypothetical protein